VLVGTDSDGRLDVRAAVGGRTMGARNRVLLVASRARLPGSECQPPPVACPPPERRAAARWAHLSSRWYDPSSYLKSDRRTATISQAAVPMTSSNSNVAVRPRPMTTDTFGQSGDPVVWEDDERDGRTSYSHLAALLLGHLRQGRTSDDVETHDSSRQEYAGEQRVGEPIYRQGCMTPNVRGVMISVPGGIPARGVRRTVPPRGGSPSREGNSGCHCPEWLAPSTSCLVVEPRFGFSRSHRLSLTGPWQGLFWCREGSPVPRWPHRWRCHLE